MGPFQEEDWGFFITLDESDEWNNEIYESYERYRLNDERLDNEWSDEQWDDENNDDGWWMGKWALLLMLYVGNVSLRYLHKWVLEKK